MASVLSHNPKQLKTHPIQEKPLQLQICQVSGLSHLPSCNAVSQNSPPIPEKGNQGPEGLE